MWEIHHKAEILPCGVFSQNDLKQHNLFFKQPAKRLIFLPKSEHKAIHNKANPPMHNSKSIAKVVLALSKPVVQLNKHNLSVIAEFSSTNDADKHTKVWRGSISACCKRKSKSAGGFIWMYKEDYEKMQKGI